MECLSLHSKAVLKEKRAEIFLGSSYQHIFTSMLTEAKVHFDFFFPLTTEEAGTGFLQGWLLLPGVSYCVAVPTC